MVDIVGLEGLEHQEPAYNKDPVKFHPEYDQLILVIGSHLSSIHPPPFQHPRRTQPFILQFVR